MRTKRWLLGHTRPICHQKALGVNVSEWLHEPIFLRQHTLFLSLLIIKATYKPKWLPSPTLVIRVSRHNLFIKFIYLKNVCFFKVKIGKNFRINRIKSHQLGHLNSWVWKLKWYKLKSRIKQAPYYSCSNNSLSLKSRTFDVNVLVIFLHYTYSILR